ncbi:MAG TPA: hypothetical protein PLV68_15580 [Ilumatobacteraceae bacterium]|nr:hypothetical protein [Ilumatobacteraceae bacterium]
MGPLGLGSLIVKPRRHVTFVGDLSDDEVSELGPLLRTASAIAAELVGAEQVYNCLWSHAEGKPGHLHYVVQPVTAEAMNHHGTYGPALQMAMFTAGDRPSTAEIEAIAARARAAFAN